MDDVRAEFEGDQVEPLNQVWHITETGSLMSLCGRLLSSTAEVHPLAWLSETGQWCNECKREYERRQTVASAYPVHLRLIASRDVHYGRQTPHGAQTACGFVQPPSTFTIVRDPVDCSRCLEYARVQVTASS